MLLCCVVRGVRGECLRAVVYSVSKIQRDLAQSHKCKEMVPEKFTVTCIEVGL